MLGNKDKAATSAEATAQNYNQLNESYQSCASKASTNLEQIANLLLTLAVADLSEAQRLPGWLLFKRKLHLYYSEAES